MRFCRWLAVAVFVAAAGGRAVAANEVLPGFDRNFIIDGAGASAKPLIIALHGGGGSAKRFRRTSTLLEPALADGFVVVWPDSDGGNWNDGRIAPDGALISDSNDEAFLLALIQSLKDRGVADGRNVFVTGHSNGGMMSFALGCRNPRVFRAMAPISANVPRPMDCAGEGAIAMLNIVGQRDRVVPVTGGGIFGRTRRGELFSAADGFKALAARNRCTDVETQDRAQALVSVGKGCAAPVIQKQLKRQGHGWPKNEAPGIVQFFKSQLR